MKYWTDYHIIFKGINTDLDEFMRPCFCLTTVLRDNKKSYDVVTIQSLLSFGCLYLSVDSNEKMIKKLNIPCYSHYANKEYLEAKEYLDNKCKKGKRIKCISLGTGNVSYLLRSILHYWKNHGYEVNSVEFYRNTGSTEKMKTRRYSINKRM